MRTTVDIDDDLLSAAREIARREQTTAGRVMSRLLREALTGMKAREPAPAYRTRSVAGFRPFPGRGKLITNDEVNALREQEGI